MRGGGEGKGGLTGLLMRVLIDEGAEGLEDATRHPQGEHEPSPSAPALAPLPPVSLEALPAAMIAKALSMLVLAAHSKGQAWQRPHRGFIATAGPQL